MTDTPIITRSPNMSEPNKIPKMKPMVITAKIVHQMRRERTNVAHRLIRAISMDSIHYK
jgi:hypothetical protein